MELYESGWVNFLYCNITVKVFLKKIKKNYLLYICLIWNLPWYIGATEDGAGEGAAKELEKNQLKNFASLII